MGVGRANLVTSPTKFKVDLQFANATCEKTTLLDGFTIKGGSVERKPTPD